jgi:hypothetical protein
MRRRETLDHDDAAHNQGTPETRHVNSNHTLQRTAQPVSGENNSSASAEFFSPNSQSGCPLDVVGHPSRVKVEEH